MKLHSRPYIVLLVRQVTNQNFLATNIWLKTAIKSPIVLPQIGLTVVARALMAILINMTPFFSSLITLCVNSLVKIIVTLLKKIKKVKRLANIVN